MTDLFAPETFARVTRGTSREAQRAVAPRAPNLRTRIWQALTIHGPRTPDEVADLLAESILSVRPQFTLLTKENKIADTGQRRRNDSGREAMVWRALPEREWRGTPDHLTAQERIEKLMVRVAYLEMLLTKEGVPYD